MSLDCLSDASREVLDRFRDAGVLSAGDVHTAATIARLCGDDDADVVLAVALAARGPRYGHVCVDLTTVATSALAETTGVGALHPVESLGWPTDTSAWCRRVAASPVVGGDRAPLVLAGSLLYLERYRAYETQVVEQLVRRAGRVRSTGVVDTSVADELLAGEGSAAQRAAVSAALGSGLSVLIGGPGTGKTRTVAALLAVLVADGRARSVALAAPTGKAAARLSEAFRDAAAQMPPAVAERLAVTDAVTIHRLLGWQSRSSTRFRHNAERPLPYDVVIVDETSMVSLPLMAKLLEAVRPDAQLVLVGDPGQLASVEAGSVLGDVAAPAGARGPLAGVVSELTYSRRFPPGSPLDRFAAAVRAGDADTAISVLSRDGTAERGAVAWIDQPAEQAAAAVRDLVVPAADEVVARSIAGDAAGALEALAAVRVLCAHRRGPTGVETWNTRIEGWLAAAGRRTTGWYPGRPVLVTVNDYANQLFNGDMGVVVGGQIAFPSGTGTRLIAPSRVADIDTVHAMTIHKSQGSEFDHVVVVVPPGASRLATRELLYTAVTRARRLVTVVGDEESVRAAIGRRVVRASGLSDRLWTR